MVFIIYISVRGIIESINNNQNIFCEISMLIQQILIWLASITCHVLLH